MSKVEFLKLLQEEVLDVDYEITMDTNLKHLEEWDSLAIVTFIAVCKSVFKKTVVSTDVANIETVEGLYLFLELES